jgi:putative SOS response-associated peptidase YedK
MWARLFFTAGRRVSFLNATTGGLPRLAAGNPGAPPCPKGGLSFCRHRARERGVGRLDRSGAGHDIASMCGRFLNKLAAAEIARIFGTRNALPNYPARFNIAPTDPVLTVRFNPKTKERTLDALRWGLVPYWAKDLKIGSKMINARAETVVTMPAFRDAFRERRCIIPASGFYEWQKTDTGKQPYAIVSEGEPFFAFVGLWENWRVRAAADSAEWIRTCAIITGEPNELVAPIHNRMPVILPSETWAAWLGEEPASADELQALLRPYPAERMRAYPVSAKVNSVKNDEPSLLDAVSA